MITTIITVLLFATAGIILADIFLYIAVKIKQKKNKQVRPPERLSDPAEDIENMETAKKGA